MITCAQNIDNSQVWWYEKQSFDSAGNPDSVDINKNVIENNFLKAL